MYDYNLAPASFQDAVDAIPMWYGRLEPRRTPAVGAAVSMTRVARSSTVSGPDWIVNSRNTADEIVVRTIGSMAGFEPNIVHRADSLDLVQDLIRAGLGVGLLPLAQPPVRRRQAGPADRARGDPAGVRGEPPRPVRLATPRAGPGRPARTGDGRLTRHCCAVGGHQPRTADAMVTIFRKDV